MTIKQRQHLLAYLGYYHGLVDGDWGQLSQEACRRFQEDLDLTVDGYGGPDTDAALKNAVAQDLFATDANVVSKPETGTFWENSEFFGREEFRCQCNGKYCNGFPVEPEEELVRVCNEIRRRLGVPVTIVDGGGSGVRCPQHNAAVGGVGNSNHLYGKAAVLGNTGELGLYDWGIHVAVNCNCSRFNG